ncbi:amidohydrolase [Bdellovibrio sp. GT3]|uniref:amidohydrolase n=1 Tax=Bdellovibrio sp. GT3 TaxID=3136282 RepID=UPI0030F3089C
MRLIAAITLILGFQANAKAPDAIWYGGPILTMNDKLPQAEAIAISDGKITAVGARKDLLKTKSAATRLIDLKGKTLLPGFIDAHSHVSMVGQQAISANLLSPPDGPITSIPDLQAALTEYIKASPTPKKYGMVLGMGYDDAQLKEQRHPTRQDLDKVSTEVPIVIMHQSGHFGVANSKALAMAGVNKNSANPPGGVIRRQSNSEPNGVLEENAFFLSLVKLFPKMTESQKIEMLEAGIKIYKSYGYTTVQDGRSSPEQIAANIAAAKSKRLDVDIVSYPDVLTPGTEELMKAPYFHDTTQKPKYQNRFRIGGVKLTLDGSPQAKTAWLTKPYYKVPEGLPKNYSGYEVVPDAKVLEVLEQSLRNHWQIITHANGDRAIDQLITAIRISEKKYPGVDVRPVLIHGQTLRKDQIADLKKLKIFPSLFPMHTFYWGDWHRTSVLGPERAENISPTGWVLAENMKFTSHHDAPVVFPDSIRVLASTVNRTTRSDYVLGPEQRVDPLTALKSQTLWSAYQHFEEGSKGSLEVGKLADFAILSENPLTIPPAQLINIKVLETIKEGKSIYSRNPDKPEGNISYHNSHDSK